MENFDLINHSPLETYSSVLIWLPEDSLIRARYTKLEAYPYSCRVICGQRKAWDACELILDCRSPVNSVAFSPDGSRVVSASHETTVRIWNARTGGLEAVLEGHTHLRQHLLRLVIPYKAYCL
jgi:WD40 repeat protein